MIKKFLENLKSECVLLSCQTIGMLFLGTLFLVYNDIGYLLGSSCFGILLGTSILAIWLNSDKNSGQDSRK